MYGDAEYPCNDTSLYKDPTNPPDYAQDMPMLEWRRPHEIVEDPVMIKDGFNPGDVKQGILGDCWLLGAFMILGVHPELL